ncbi:hypothetical protein ACLOJK_031925 [Asimina triloba]
MPLERVLVTEWCQHQTLRPLPLLRAMPLSVHQPLLRALERLIPVLARCYVSPLTVARTTGQEVPHDRLRWHRFCAVVGGKVEGASGGSGDGEHGHLGLGAGNSNEDCLITPCCQTPRR